MSWWTHIHGLLTVHPSGRSTEEREFVLKSTLQHLPVIYQDGGVMETLVTRSAYGGISESIDRFGQHSNLPYQKNEFGFFENILEFFVVVDANVRYETFDEVYPQFIKWLCRFARRMLITEVMVDIYDYDKRTSIRHLAGDSPNPWSNMYKGEWADKLYKSRWEYSQ